MIAYGIHPYKIEHLIIIFFTIITLHSGYFAALIWNDITDADIDQMVHPDRPLPGKRITSRRYFAIALIFSGLTFIFAFLVNLWCFLLVGATALFVAIHDKYLKKKMNIPAYSEIFTPIQWCIVPVFGYIAAQNYIVIPIVILVLFTYFADVSHDIAEGIHDSEADKKYNVHTFSTSFREQIAAKSSFIILLISGAFGIALYAYTPLSTLFLIGFLGIWVYTLYRSYPLLTSSRKDMKQIGQLVGKREFDYLLAVYIFIFLDIFTQHIGTM
jgi:4-hydroxybenzoate polyprenyltransferase